MRRRGMTLAEVLVFAGIGLVLVVVLLGLLRTARVQDGFNEDRLHVLSALGIALEHVRRDAWVAHPADYALSGHRLTRNGVAVRGAPLEALDTKPGDLPLMTLTAANGAYRATVTVPLLTRRALARKDPALAGWAAADDARGE
jgi:hypothetical protein